MMSLLRACFYLHSLFLLMLQYMQYHGVECEILALPTCEPNKSFNLIFQVAERLEAFKLNRYMSLLCNAYTLFMLLCCNMPSASVPRHVPRSAVFAGALALVYLSAWRIQSVCL